MPFTWQDLIGSFKRTAAFPAGILGQPGDLANMASSAVGYGTPFAGVEQMNQMFGVPPATNPAEQFTQRTLENLGGLLMPGIGTAGRVALGGAELASAPAATLGEMAGQTLAQGTPWEGFASMLGGTLGGVGGAIAPHLVSKVPVPSRLANERGSVGKPPGYGTLIDPLDEIGPLWRDNILDALGEMKQDKFSPDQLKAHLRGYRGTSDQAKWIGLDDFLEGKKGVTRGEVEEYVRGNELRVEEVVLGQGMKPKAILDANNHYTLLNSNTQEVLERDVPPHMLADRREYWTEAKGKARYDSGSLVTPGGENYWELLITLPVRKWIDGPPDASGQRPLMIHPSFVENTTHYQDPHFQQPNVLAHVRFNERTTPEGKRMLFLEEVQSDWHQRGAKKGYNGPGRNTHLGPAPTRAETVIKFDEELGEYVAARATPDGAMAGGPASGGRTEDEAYENLVRYWNEVRERINPFVGGVPDAPFKKTWPLLAMKRMIRWAAENGFDEVGWTSGEMQNKRYNKELRRIEAVEREAGADTPYLKTRKSDGSYAWKPAQTKQEQQELARLLGDRWHEDYTKKLQVDLADRPIEVGDKALPNFYDRELVNDTNKFVKRWGGKVEQKDLAASLLPPEPVKLTSRVDQDGHKNFYIQVRDANGTVSDHSKYLTLKDADDAYADMESAYRVGKRDTPTKVWTLRLTPQLKRAALRGMELSSATPQADTMVG